MLSADRNGLAQQCDYALYLNVAPQTCSEI